MERATVVSLVLLGLSACAEPADKPVADTGAQDLGAADAGDTGRPDAAPDPDLPAANQWCPVVGYEACGGDLTGTWAFRSLCPEDAAAAAALCEHPYDDQAVCTGPGNEARCDTSYEGTLTFGTDAMVTIAATDTIIASWNFTDDCLAAVARGTTPEERCASLGNERLTCTYDGACHCVGAPIVQEDLNTVPFAVDGMDVTLGEDPPASYCVDGDRLTMDYYVFHPVSWRYWVLERQ